MLSHRVGERLAVTSVRPHCAHCKMRRNPPAAVNDGRRCGGKLDRRNLKGLSEGDGSKLHRPDVFHLVHDGPRLTRQINSCLIQKPELPEVGVIPLHAYAEPHRDKDGIAGIHRSLHEILRPVASHLMTADFSVFHHDEAGAAERICGLHRPGFQPGSSRDDFKGGSRLVGVIDTAVSPHGV